VSSFLLPPTRLSLPFLFFHLIPSSHRQHGFRLEGCPYGQACR
jgi:hypothetical protein